ncbi:uncharacterized protein LOC109608695 isoform X2 [Aethina tumida]|uniref:uncharacterized protein LOC109608695 isoform X2 n=1 Tax=Aethina tumida TaxID=116153 RepID=UPI002148EDF6|nr:uncharacterized protein LOC109608695 isoform X2 [Aethina tumida]
MPLWLMGTVNVSCPYLKSLTMMRGSITLRLIVLQNVTKQASGTYSCEVSADQPNFSTGSKTFYLQVVDLPKTDPQINGLKSRYKLDESIDANCTSFGSDPAVNITWYLNGIPLNTSRTNYSEGLTVSVIGFNLSSTHFINDKLKIRCSVTLFDVYHRSCEKSVDLKKIKPNVYRYDVQGYSTNVADSRFDWDINQHQRPLDSSWIQMDAISVISYGKTNHYNIFATIFMVIIYFL